LITSAFGVVLILLTFCFGNVFASEGENGQIIIFIPDEIADWVGDLAQIRLALGHGLDTGAKPFLRLKADWPEEKRKEWLYSRLNSAETEKKKEYFRKLIGIEEERPGYVPVGLISWQGDEILDLRFCMVDGVSNTFPSYYWLDKPARFEYEGQKGNAYPINLPVGKYIFNLFLAYRDEKKFKDDPLSPLGEDTGMEVKLGWGRKLFIFGDEPGECEILSGEGKALIWVPGNREIREWSQREISGVNNLVQGVDYK
jgi:hypothetical protein